MTDYHCHILPALDDGAETVEEALEMAALLALAGFREVHCTPHCLKGSFETSPGQVREGVAALQEAVDAAGIGIRLLTGMEYCLDEYFPDELERLVPLGESRLVLVEVPFRGDPALVRDHLRRLLDRQYTPLIAHPERTPLLRAGPEPGILSFFLKGSPARKAGRETCNDFLRELQSMGCLFQGNLGSFSGFYGEGVKQFAEDFLAAGLYHCLGTDAHRPAQIREGSEHCFPKVGLL